MSHFAVDLVHSILLFPIGISGNSLALALRNMAVISDSPKSASTRVKRHQSVRDRCSSMLE